LISPKNFQVQIQLRTHQGLFNVSMAKFLRSDNVDSDSPEKQAWIRCRGSSVLNFDIHAIWQLMFMRYPKATAKITFLSTVSHLTTIFNSDFNVELNKWYTCDTRTNSLLNNSMNFRRKVVATKIHLGMSDEPLNCNLHTFTFANDDKTVVGYLRWIPKLILNDERNKNKIHEVDNFQMMANVEPTPLTTEFLADEMSHDDEEVTDEVDGMGDNNDDNDDASTTIKKRVCLQDKSVARYKRDEMPTLLWS
jgi:hypothetical protein